MLTLYFCVLICCCNLFSASFPFLRLFISLNKNCCNLIGREPLYKPQTVQLTIKAVKLHAIINALVGNKQNGGQVCRVK